MNDNHPLLGCQCDFGCQCNRVPQMGSFLSSITSLFTPAATTPGETIAPTALDTTTGQNAMQYFYNEAMTYPNVPYPAAWADFITYINQANPGLFQSLGMVINNTGVSTTQVQNAMIKMADNGQGQLPVTSNGLTNWGAFSSAIGQAGMNPSFWSALVYTAEATADQVASGAATVAEDVGQGVISTGSMLATLTTYLPYVLLAAGGLYIFVLAGGPEKLLGSAFKKKEASNG